MQNETSSLDRCLKPLLKWLHWQGSERVLFESLPHLQSIETVESFRWVMKNLGYQSNAISLNLKFLDERLFPCLFIPKDNGAPQILIEKVGECLSVFDSESDKSAILRDLNVDGTI